MQSPDKTPGNVSFKKKKKKRENLMFDPLVLKQMISFSDLSDIIKEWHAFDATLQPQDHAIIMPCVRGQQQTLGQI